MSTLFSGQTSHKETQCRCCAQEARPLPEHPVTTYWIPLHDVAEEWGTFGATASSFLALAATGEAFLALSWERSALHHHAHHALAWHRQYAGLTAWASSVGRLLHLVREDLERASRCWCTAVCWLEELANQCPADGGDDPLETLRPMIHLASVRQRRVWNLIREVEYDSVSREHTDCSPASLKETSRSVSRSEGEQSSEEVPR